MTVIMVKPGDPSCAVPPRGAVPGDVLLARDERGAVVLVPVSPTAIPIPRPAYGLRRAWPIRLT